MVIVEMVQSQCGSSSHHFLQRMAAWKTVCFLKEARTRMPTTTLSLLFLAQQVLLPDTLNGWRCEDIMDSRRQEGHGLELVLKLSSVLRRRNLLCVLAVLTLDHLFDPCNNTKQVACRGHEIVFQDLVHAFTW
jgi:hypothetical protein